MRSWTYRCLWMIVLLLGSPALAPAQATAETTILIDATKIGSHAVPRTIFGTFLEPIGNSTYNGLWAEILQNPSFENNLWDVKHIADMVRDDPELNRASEMSLPLPWEPLRYSQGSRYAPQWNDAANSQRSLLLMALPDQQTGIRQKVYLPVRRVSHYVGSVYLRHVGGPAIVEVSLRERNHPDHIFNSREIKPAPRGGNVTNSRSMFLPINCNLLSLRISSSPPVAKLALLVDQASLLPGDNVDGMDPEMIAMSRDLKTPIVRFGGNFTSAYHWRDGVGPRDQRVSMLNAAWGIPEYNQFGRMSSCAFAN